MAGCWPRGSYNGQIRLWDLQSKKELNKSEGHGPPVSKLEFSTDGDRLTSREYAGQVIDWDLRSASKIRERTEMLPPELGYWLGDGSYRVGLHINVDPTKSRMIVADVDRNRVMHDFGRAPLGLACALVTPDGKRMITASHRDGGDFIETWDLLSGKVLNSWTAIGEANYRPTFFWLPSSRLLFTWRNKVAVLDAATGKVLAEWQPLEKELRPMKNRLFSFYRRRMASRSHAPCRKKAESSFAIRPPDERFGGFIVPI